MAIKKKINKVAKELNTGYLTLLEHLETKGFEVAKKINFTLSPEMYEVLLQDFKDEKMLADEAKTRVVNKRIVTKKEEVVPVVEEESQILVKNTLLSTPIIKEEVKEVVKAVEKPKDVEEVVVDPIVEEKAAEKLQEEKKKDDLEKLGPKVLGSIEIPVEKKAKKITKDTPKPIVKKPVEVVAPKVIKEEKKKVELPKKVEVKPKVKPVVVEAPIELLTAKKEKLKGLSVVDKIIIPKDPPKAKKVKLVTTSKKEDPNKRKRKRIGEGTNTKPATGTRTPYQGNKTGGANKGGVNKKPVNRNVRSQKPVQSRRANRKKRKADFFNRREQENIREESERSVLKVTEFVTANELANLMKISVNEIISTCFAIGMMVSINQRLDADTLNMVAEEFGYTLEFTDAQEVIDFGLEKEEDLEADQITRSPVVTVMGHVDHGKTSLLDYLREENVIDGEAGGITQHVGAYEVKLKDGRKITFLDTPGHAAFTAMRSRGAKLTDIAIIVIAADDRVMPQTKEAISHAQAAGIPMIFAINKMDKPTANAEKIKEELSAMNILVEDWGGKFQSEEISAKKGTNIDSLLEKVVLEAEVLELKANPKLRASGSIIEVKQEKGRGIVADILVQNGSLNIGNHIVAGAHYAKIRAMFNEYNKPVKVAGPSVPIRMLGFSTAPMAGDLFEVIPDERKAKDVAKKRLQLQREQGVRTKKHLTLDEIGRRLAVGNFKELKLIIKADVDGSAEALADSLLNLSTEEIQVSIIQKAVGDINENDVLLASASEAIIIGFNVKPTSKARVLAENEKVDINIYDIIYKAIDDIKDAMEGLLVPDIVEKEIGKAEVRDVFRIPKKGTIAGCMVLNGKIERGCFVRVNRGGEIIHTAKLGSLKRFKDDVKDVAKGFECGMGIDGFNNIEIDDVLECYVEEKVKRKLK